MSAGKRRLLHELEENLDIVSRSEPAQLLEEERLRKEIAELREKIARVPFIDTFDLRYKNYEKRPEPSSQAVMFCLMDVSGSMDQATKDMAKRFYILLYLFLSRTYKNVEVVLYSPPYSGQRGGRTRVLLLAGNRRHYCLQRPEING
ncbi:Uncharacterized conserved protein [Cedecea neteri]|uniref:Uncharacterized conserved protein n=1 Tax=Cedecea neteri TaxID=158822 RepID=A0A2X3J5M5_9ENTR|nr:Uncharacterized conserved protein [Cedecea neteri]